MNSHAVDLVSVCTPPQTHFGLVKTALEAGSHVLVEKPIFESLEEAELIREIAAKTERIVCPVHNRRFAPGMEKAIDLFQTGAIGEVRHLHVVQMRNGHKDRMISDPDFWVHQLPGGIWGETLPHRIYMAYQFMGPMKFVDLRMKNTTNQWPWLVSEDMEILLEAATGYVTINFSPNVTKNHEFVFCLGSKRRLFINNTNAIDPAPGNKPLRLGKEGCDTLWQGVQAAGTLLLPRQVKEQKRLRIRGHGRLIRELVENIKEGKESPVGWEEAMHTLALTITINREINRQSTQ